MSSDRHVRQLLVAAGIMLVILPLIVRAQLRAGGGPGGVLGPLNSLGQEVRLPPPPSGPTPRLPDGTIDLNGVWNGGGPGGALAQGLKPGETLPLLPSAKALMDLRATREMDDPFFWCMPMGVPRTTPYPFRFVQNYTHKAPTHMFLLHEGNIHSYRQIFLDGANIRRSSTRPGSAIRSDGSTTRTRSSSTRSATTTSSGSTAAGPRTPNNCTPSNDGRGPISGASSTP